MYGVQLDQLATLLASRGEPSGDPAGVARQLVARWQAAGYAETGQLTLGEPWIWASRAGMNACGLRARAIKPSAKLLRHIHAVTDVRLAVERTAVRAAGLRLLTVGGPGGPQRPHRARHPAVRADRHPRSTGIRAAVQHPETGMVAMTWRNDRRQPYRPGNPEAGLAIIRLVAAAAAIVVAPVTATAVAAYAVAWWRGWPPRRLYLAAAWCSPLAAGWLGAATVWPAGLPGPESAQWWLRLAVAPYRGWRLAELAAIHGQVIIGILVIAPLAIPAGLAAGGLAWARRQFRMAVGTGGAHPGSPARFDARLWSRQARTARAIATSSLRPLPLMRADGSVVAGATIRTVGHQAGRAAVIPYERLRSHQVVIGSTGTGKTTLLLRLWAAFMAGGLQRHADGLARRPLLVVLDCKGGESSRQTAARARHILQDAGAATVASWPQVPLSLWSLPPSQLVSTLLDLIEHGTGGAAYYTDIMESLVGLAVGAPPGPPASSAEFLARLDASWLVGVYTAAGDLGAAGQARAGRKGIDDVALRFRALWRRLGPGLVFIEALGPARTYPRRE
jgi:hypothetical protein